MNIYCDASATEICWILGEGSNPSFSYKHGLPTINQAEAQAICDSLWVAEGATQDFPVVVCTDSQLIARQINGEYAVRNKDLKYYVEKAQRKLKTNPNLSVVWIPREQNLAGKVLEERKKQGDNE